MSKKFVTIKQLAEELEMDRSHARRYVLKLDVTPTKRRTADSGGQLVLTVSKEEAEFIKKKRGEEGFLGSSKTVDKEVGSFYVIQLVPELDENRIKLGFAGDVNQRLAQHRTSAPTARVLATWPCKRNWEKTVIDALARVEGKLILNEVYEFADVEQIIEHGNRLFELLGDPSLVTEISAASPHNDTENVE